MKKFDICLKEMEDRDFNSSNRTWDRSNKTTSNRMIRMLKLWTNLKMSFFLSHVEKRCQRNQQKVFSKITTLTKTSHEASFFFGSECGGILSSLRYVSSHQVIFATNLFQKPFQSSHPQSNYKDAWVNWRNICLKY